MNPRDIPRSTRPSRPWPLDRRSFLKGSAAAAAAGLFTSMNAKLAFGQPNPLIVDVTSVPVPDFGGTNRHAGVDAALRALACAGVFFYRADSSFPLSDPAAGLIAPDDVVLIKVNGQWQYRGVTNSDVVRGVIQRILEHPAGFTGEVVIFENGQGRGSLNCDNGGGNYPDHNPHANAEDETHTFQYLIDTVFAGAPVSGYLLDPIRGTWIGDTEHAVDGYRQAGFVSYPCFTTARGARVELREGIWDGLAYRSNLKLLNIPVFKTHGGSAVTGALKHMYGVLSMDYNSGEYHYAQFGNAVGDMHTLVRTPTLNLLDCIWVSPGALAGYPASTTVRTNRLVAGFDPVAIDYYAGKHIMYPAGGRANHDPDNSAEYRAGLQQACDRINANGGINGEPATFDEALFNVVSWDASAGQPVGALRVVKESGETRIEWDGGSPPFRVLRSEARDFSNPMVLTDCCFQNSWVDAGTLQDGVRYFYRVEGRI